MKRLFSTQTILLAALCFAVINSPSSAKTMYKWTDKNGKVSFSDQVPPSKAELGHQELDKNAQVIKETEKAKTKEELEVEKRMSSLKKRQEEIVAKQTALDKKLVSSFLSLEAMDATYKSKRQVFNDQDREFQETIKKTEAELTEQHKKAASYEVKNQKVPADFLSQMEENQKKITKAKQDIKQLQLKKAVFEKQAATDRARFVLLTDSKTSAATPAAGNAAKKISSQPGIFNCENAEQCEKAWGIAKEFMKTNSTAKISVDTPVLVTSEDPVSDTDFGLSISKMSDENKNLQIFLDIRCVDTVAAKALCSGSKADELRVRFTEYLKTSFNSMATSAPATPKTP